MRSFTIDRNRITLAYTGILLISGLLVIPAQAVAATAPQTSQPVTQSALTGLVRHHYDGKSPVATGCINDARTVAKKRVGPRGAKARILLRYSPRCRTVWAQIIRAASRNRDRAGGSAVIRRNQDGASIRCRSKQGHTGCHTKMLYDGGFTSYAKGINDVGWTIHKARTRSF